MSIGFIKNSLEIMELILYILARVDGPLTMGELTDLALCDEGVDYFQFADALGRLEETGHVEKDGEGKILITSKGRTNGATTEEELPYSVRIRCDRNVAAMNKKLRRARQVRTEITRRPDGSGCTAKLILDDDHGNIMTLEMLAPDATQAEILCNHYKAKPEDLYNAILMRLLGE